MHRSAAVRFMLAPAREYHAAVATRRDASWTRALTVPALLALLLGIVTSIAAAGRTAAPIVLGQILCWSFVPVLQIATGAALVRSARDRRVSVARAIELLFAGHGPWSFWLIGMAALMLAAANQTAILASAPVPMVWTAVLMSAYGREVLGLTRRAAWARALIHQLATVAVIVIYVELATQLSARILGALQQ